jgi:hypothetical protein
MRNIKLEPLKKTTKLLIKLLKYGLISYISILALAYVFASVIPAPPADIREGWHKDFKK